MSMAHGLELRVPFLDRALVEACFRIPGPEKLKGDSPKSLLLASLGVELPREVVNRPKRGFTLPFEHWLRHEMRPGRRNCAVGGRLGPERNIPRPQCEPYGSGFLPGRHHGRGRGRSSW